MADSCKVHVMCACKHARPLGQDTSAHPALTPCACMPRHAGNCSPELKQFCGDISAGEGRLADCISDQITEAESNGESEGAHEIKVAAANSVYQLGQLLPARHLGQLRQHRPWVVRA